MTNSIHSKFLLRYHRKHQATQEMKMLHRALVISHCDYVRERLKEHLGNPTSNNVLSESSCETILARLDKELGLLNAQNNDELVPVEPIEEEIKYKTMIQDNRAIHY